MTNEDIKNWLKDGSFFQNVDASYCVNDITLEKHLVRMHNEGEINLIELFSNASKSDITYNFFHIKSFFEKILPNIEANIIDVSKCVFKLINETKPDESAYFIYDPFVEFCSKTEDRSDNLLRNAIENSDFNEFISLALISGFKVSPEKYKNKAIELIKTSKDSNILEQSIFAIFKMDISNPKDVDKIIELFFSILDKCNKDSTLEKILQTIYKFSKTSSNQLRINELIDKILKNGNDQVLHRVAIILQDKDILNSPSLESFFCAIQNINPINARTIKELDYGIINLISCGFDIYRIFEFIRLYTNKNAKNFKISEFEYFSYKLTLNENYILDKFITDCFFNPTIVISFSLQEILSKIEHNKAINLKYDSAKFPTLSSLKAFFLAKKALAHLYYQPNECISYIRSILKFFNNDDINSFKKIFFEFFGLGYPNIIANICDEKNISVNEKKFFMYSKLEFEKINKLLGDKTFIFELEPSNANKKACLDYKNNLLEIAYKNASKQSIAELICKRIKILHGVGMFMPINQYAKAPSEINYMQKHEFSRLVPMIPYINPVIFSIGLTNFKIETLMQ